jgi:hypothetical protein
MHDNTYLGLNKWCNNIFENFGWMILAHRNGENKQIISYKQNIETLIEHINHKIKHLQNINKKEKNLFIIDKINELKIMADNLLTLHMHVEYLCKNK